MAKLTPQEAREKHARRLKGSVEDIRRGIERVSVAPGVEAAKKAEKMRQGINRALDEGTWQKNVASVPLDEWKNKALNKGLARISQGIDEAGPKMEEFYDKLFAHQDKLQGELSSMADLTLEDNINRMTHFVRGMSKFRK